MPTESATATPVEGVPWAFETAGEVTSSPAVAPIVAGVGADGATVYVGSRDGALYALDAATGG